MIEASYHEAKCVLTAAVNGEISPREAEWGLVDVLSGAGEDIDPRAADLIDTALSLLGEWDRGDRALEHVLAEFERLATRHPAGVDGQQNNTRLPASRLARST